MFNPQDITTEAPASIEEWSHHVRQLHDRDDWAKSALPTLPVDAPAWCVEIEEDRSDYPSIMFSLLGRQWGEDSNSLVRVEQLVSVKVDAATHDTRVSVKPAEVFINVDRDAVDPVNAIKLARAIERAAADLERLAA